jgi:hypothetical protein
VSAVNQLEALRKGIGVVWDSLEECIRTPVGRIVLH